MRGSFRIRRARSSITRRNYSGSRWRIRSGIAAGEGFCSGVGVEGRAVGAGSWRLAGGRRVARARGAVADSRGSAGESGGTAFLGGLILNLMPCVFPILAMKAVGFAAGLARGRARAHAVSYTVGVTATFVAWRPRCWWRVRRAPRRVGDFSSRRRFSSRRWRGCCSLSG